jgi:hypothetical protein
MSGAKPAFSLCARPVIDHTPSPVPALPTTSTAPRRWCWQGQRPRSSGTIRCTREPLISVPSRPDSQAARGSSQLATTCCRPKRPRPGLRAQVIPIRAAPAAEIYSHNFVSYLHHTAYGTRCGIAGSRSQGGAGYCWV